MVEKKITRKVISKVSTSAETEAPKADEAKQEKTKKGCFFCQSKTDPSYANIAVLKRYISDRVKIVSRDKSNLCSKHQRAATRHIKYARHLSLLPFIPKV